MQSFVENKVYKIFLKSTGSPIANLLAVSVSVEVIWPHFFTKHDVVVHVDELVRESRDAMDMSLYGRRAEGGQVAGVGKDFLKGHKD